MEVKKYSILDGVIALCYNYHILHFETVKL